MAGRSKKRAPVGARFPEFSLFISRAAVLILAASAAVAVMILPLMVVAAHRVRVKFQLSGQQIIHRLIRVSGHAGKQTDARLGQSRAGPAADPAADQGIRALLPQEARQCPVTAPDGADYLG